MTPHRSPPTPGNRPSRLQSGVILLEALLAILVFSVGVLTMVAFQAIAIKNNMQSKYRTDASFVANQIIGEMWVADPTQLSTLAGTYNDTSTTWGTRITKTLPSGSGNVAVASDIVTVTVSWQAPGEVSSHNIAQTVRINH